MIVRLLGGFRWALPAAMLSPAVGWQIEPNRRVGPVGYGLHCTEFGNGVTVDE